MHSLLALICTIVHVVYMHLYLSPLLQKILQYFLALTLGRETWQADITCHGAVWWSTDVWAVARVSIRTGRVRAGRLWAEIVGPVKSWAPESRFQYPPGHSVQWNLQNLKCRVNTHCTSKSYYEIIYITNLLQQSCKWTLPPFHLLVKITPLLGDVLYGDSVGYAHVHLLQSVVHVHNAINTCKSKLFITLTKQWVYTCFPLRSP